MVDIQSKEIIDKMSEDLKIQPAMQLPRELGKQILPVYVVNPNFFNASRAASTNRVITGSATIFTTNADKRTFLTGIWLHYQHNVVADSTTFTMTATPILRNVATNIIVLSKITLTATQDRIFVPFSIPMELGPDTTIIMTQTFTVGVGIMSGGITFFEVDKQ